MRKQIRIFLVVFIACVIPLASQAEIIVMNGFEASVFATGFEIPSSLEFSPSGDLLYVSDIGSSPTALGSIQTVDSNGIASTFVPESAGFAFPEALAFGSGGGFGADLYFIDSFTTAGNPRDIIFKVDSNGVATGFSNLQTTGSNDMEFGPGNQFGNNLFVASFGIGILEVDAGGSRTVFSSETTSALTLEFASGSAFNENLFVGNFPAGIFEMDSSGQAVPFFTEIDPAVDGLVFTEDALFGNFLYATDYPGGEILRIDSNGNASVFASGLQFAPPQALVPFGALAFDNIGTFDSDLFIAESGTGRIIRFSAVAEPIPEPSTILLIATGLLGFAGFRRKFRE